MPSVYWSAAEKNVSRRGGGFPYRFSIRAPNLFSLFKLNLLQVALFELTKRMVCLRVRVSVVDLPDLCGPVGFELFQSFKLWKSCFSD